MQLTELGDTKKWNYLSGECKSNDWKEYNAEISLTALTVCTDNKP